MAQPPAYDRLYNFTQYAAANPSAPYQPAYTDSELNGIQTTIAAIRTNLVLIQRDDGALKNGIVTPDSLSTSTALLLAATGCTIRGTWLTATAYALKDVVIDGTGTYICATAHTSGTFATDLTAVKWIVIYDTASFASSNSTYIQSGTGAVSRTIQTKLRETTSPGDYGGDSTGVADSAADIGQALAATTHVLLTPGTWKNTAGFSTVASKTLELMPGAAFSGAGTVTRVAGDNVISYSDGASGDCWYWGKKLTGTRTVGAGKLEGYTPNSYMFDVLTDDSDVGVAGFGVGMQVRHLFGGANTVGGRIGFLSALYLTATTKATTTNRHYVAAQASTYVQDDDGGTNTGAGALGAFFGGGSAVYCDAAAINLADVVGHEFNTFTENGSTAKYIRGLAITGCNYTRGATVDAAVTIGAQAATGAYGPHAGWRFGICFTDTNGAVPFTATSSLMGVVAASAIPLLDGFDLSGFTFAGQIIKGVYFAANESSISLGDSAGNASVTVAGASANGNLILTPKGSGVISTGVNGWAVSGTKVVGARNTGWSAMTGTTDESTVYDTAAVTLPQLAGRVMALQIALTTHGLIGT